MDIERQNRASELNAIRDGQPERADAENFNKIDPSDSKLLRDQVKGQTTEHANPPRLEDEGQSGG
jgi:hypothetical protein